jgi:GDP/UDP-N,N'-diacetylbacillosamine 2-epimerase (hydrolysing)
MKYAIAVVGNSSSGILEAPSFGTPTINIGDRQKGRILAASIIQVPPIAQQISDAIKSIRETKIKNISHTYGYGDTTKKIMDILSTRLTNIDLKKGFHDMN